MDKKIVNFITKKRVLMLLFMSCMLIPLLGSLKVFAASNSRSVSEFTYNNDSTLIYEVLRASSIENRGTVSVSGNNSSATYISIPNTVADNLGNIYTVTTISSGAFSNYKSLRSVVIPENVTTIRNGAFLDCVNLDNIRMLASSITFYNRSFENIATNATFYVVNQRVRNELRDYVENDAEIIIIGDNTSDDGIYRVTLKAEDGGKVNGGGNYNQYDTVTIRATPDKDYTFDRWEVTYGDVSIKDKYSERTSFIMSSSRVTITARFNYIYDKTTTPSENTTISTNNLNTLLQAMQLDNFFQDEKKGADIVVNLGSNTNVATSLFKDIIGKNTDIVFISNNYKWTINGKNVATDIMNKAYCNLGVNFIKQSEDNIVALTENTNILQFDLAYDSVLPFQGNLEFSIDNSGNNQYAYMYDVGSNPIKYRDYTTIGINGEVKLNVKSASKYVLTNKIIKDTYVVQRTNIPADDLGTIVPYYIEDGNSKLVIASNRNGNDVTFIAPKTAAYGYKNNAKDFGDTANHWASTSINFVTSRELFNGVAVNEFAPNSSMTKGMFLTALGNLYDLDTATYSTGGNVYYQPYVEWALANGILRNMEDVNFEESVTREEMAVIFTNYSQYINFKLPQINNSSNFADSNQISQWAISAVDSMQKAGIINGKEGNNFDPKGIATRAEASVLFKRFIENILYQSAV